MFGNFMSGQWRKPSKCKNLLQHLQNNLKILKKKKLAVSRLLRHDIAQVLIQLNDRTRAHRLTKELFIVENTKSVYDLLLQFTDFILLRFHYIKNQKFCKELLDDEINEAFSSLIFASARCGELPELIRIRKILIQRYGQLYVSTALELRQGNPVSLEIKEKLLLVTSSVSEDVTIRLLDEIAKESGLEDKLRLEYTSHETEKHVIYMNKEKSEEETSSSSNYNVLRVNIEQEEEESGLDMFRLEYTSHEIEEKSKEERSSDKDYNVLRLKIEEEVGEEKRRRLLPEHVHPKLPDYDQIVAKFKALRVRAQHRVNDNIPPNILSNIENLSQLKKLSERQPKTKPKHATKQNSASCTQTSSRKRSTTKHLRDLSPPYKIST